VSPDFNLLQLVAALSDDDVAALCAKLLEEGDAFSLVAAFEGCCAKHEWLACVAVGDRIIEALFGEGGRADQIAHDCAARRGWCSRALTSCAFFGTAITSTARNPANPSR
jgi:hypothetical protein